MPTERGHHAFGEMCLEERVGAAFVLTHQARISNYVDGDDSGKPALFVGH
jgi:hypothetical protein